MNISFPDPAVTTSWTDASTGTKWTFDGYMWVIDSAAGGAAPAALPVGGVTDAVLRKRSGADNDVEWSKTLDAGGW